MYVCCLVLFTFTDVHRSSTKKTQGAPETIQERLNDISTFYVSTYKKYTWQGSRVLALAYKPLPDMTGNVSATRNLDRDVVEIGLTFAGFAVFNCPIKGDSAAVLLEFKQSSHDLVKITGDQALTACHVACEVNIISQPALILVPMKSKQQFEWVSPDETEIVTNSEEMVDCSNSFEGIHDAFVKKVEGAVKAWATGDPFDLATRHRHQKKYTMIMEVQISPLCYCLQKKVGIVFQFPERYFVADIVLDEVILVALHLRYALDASNIALHFSNNCGVIFVSIPCLADLFKFRDNWEHMFLSSSE
ncbi:probable manganese-transporting ATPase PDR2 [Tanacetum coccineum]|uniref:Probable manganese-transporting ATPase PDR2 n=1 Tax=Tanacetum coccineum TaxID=301880 RepID=A0ABQ4ZZH2_9ASTR